MNHQKSFSSWVLALTVTGLAALLSGPSQALAVPIYLGAELATFAVLGATPVVSTANISTIGGNVGISPAAAITGTFNFFPFGSLQSNTQLAIDAQSQLGTAIGTLNGLGPGTLVSGGSLDIFQALHGGSITPGIYTVPALPAIVGGNLLGTLVLNGLGNPNAIWVFQMSSTLITSTTSNVSFINTPNSENLYWNVSSAATINGPTFAGNVLANTLISTDGNLTMTCGRLLSRTAAVTLDGVGSNISNGCGGNGGGGGGGGNVPEPASLLLLGAGLAGIGIWRRRVGKN